MYILKNIRNLVKNSKSMLVILVLSMFVSFGILFFGIGLFYQYSRNIQDGEIDNYAVGFSINETITKNDMSKFIKSMPNEQLEDVSYITCFSSTQVSGIDEDVPVAFYIQYKNGSFEYSNEVFDSMIDDLVLMSGCFFTQEQYIAGDKKAIVMGGGNEFQTTPAPDSTDTVKAFGESYDVIGIINPGISKYYFYSLYVPFNSLSDNTNLCDCAYFALNKKITKSDYDELVKNIDEYFGDKVSIYDFSMDLKSNNSYYLTVIIISVLIAVLSALNVSILYNYIIINRSSQLNIMHIYGGKTFGLSLSTTNEIMLLMIPISIVAAFIYNIFLLPVLSIKFPLITEAYNVFIYGVIIVIYCAVTYLLNLFILQRRLRKSNWRI